VRLRLLSRASALAVLQAELVSRVLRDRWPSLEVELVTRSSMGDRDPRADLSTTTEKGVFTADLSRALLDGQAEAVVHSWKDLPIEVGGRTAIAATLERADPRDVLLVRRAVVSDRPGALSLLSSSPRRAWQVSTALPRLLPWAVTDIQTVPVRGNIPTRLRKLVMGDGDALIVAKAALDRLLAPPAPEGVQAEIREALAACRWMVLPLKDCPTAPAQGAVAVEVERARADVLSCVAAIDHEPTRRAVEAERAVLASFGGGCQLAVGATVLVRDYGVVTSVRAHTAGDPDRREWTLSTDDPAPPRVDEAAIWPRLDERDGATRRSLHVSQPAATDGLWVARAEALPAAWTVDASTFVWAAGARTWERLAARGVWVHGSADGLGDGEAPAIDRLAGRQVTWLRLTHRDAADPQALATYDVDRPLPADLGSRSHFFWTSGSLLRRALETCPAIRAGWHASGPGRTAQVMRDMLGASARTSLWLDYEQWHRHVTF
jgi:hydroxymethylbilane synthase